jgi:hypothetical protein
VPSRFVVAAQIPPSTSTQNTSMKACWRPIAAIAVTGLGQGPVRSDAPAAQSSTSSMHAADLVHSGRPTNTAMWSGSSDIAASGEPGTVADGVATAVRATGPGLSEVGVFQVGAWVLPGIPTGAYTVDTRLAVSDPEQVDPVSTRATIASGEAVRRFGLLTVSRSRSMTFVALVPYWSVLSQNTPSTFCGASDAPAAMTPTPTTTRPRARRGPASPVLGSVATRSVVHDARREGALRSVSGRDDCHTGSGGVSTR